MVTPPRITPYAPATAVSNSGGVTQEIGPDSMRDRFTSGGPSSYRAPSGISAGDPGLADEAQARLRTAHHGREVRIPIVGQSQSDARGGGDTMSRPLQDTLRNRARETPAAPSGALESFARDPAGQAEIATVRDGLQSARSEIRSGDYEAASARLADLRDNHSIGFFANGNLGLEGYNGADNLQRQADFAARMERRLGSDVSFPPSEQDTTAYFESFNNPTDRAQAQQEFSDYTRAFYTHTQQALGQETDVRYSPDGNRYVYGGNIYSSERASPEDAVRVPTSVPSAWSDVAGSSRQIAGFGAGDGSHAGRRIIDCEGYAYLSQRLMGAAGYEVTHVTGGTESLLSGGDPSALHSMTELRDPSNPTGRAIVQSNAGFEDDVYSAYRRAGGSPGMSDTPVFFRSSDMRDSQVLSMDPAPPD